MDLNQDLHFLPNLRPLFINILEEENLFYKNLEKNGKSRNTLKNYKTDLECFNKFWKNQNSRMDLNGLDTNHMVLYGEYLDGNYSSDNSKRRKIQTLRIFFDFLLSKKLVDHNPVKSICSAPKFLDIPRPSPLIDVKTLYSDLLKKSLDKDELKALIGKRNLIVFLLIYTGGLKVSDIAKIKEEHLFLGEKPRILVCPSKRDPFTVSLHPIFNELYADYQKDLKRWKEISQIEFSHILFNANHYKIISGALGPRGLELVFEELKNKLSIQLTPKSLRQACIFNWIHKGINESLIKEWMNVAPNYSLKLYKDHLNQNFYNESFLEEIYFIHQKNINRNI